MSANFLELKLINSWKWNCNDLWNRTRWFWLAFPICKFWNFSGHFVYSHYWNFLTFRYSRNKKKTDIFGLNLPKRTSRNSDIMGYIGVADGCWRRNVLATILRCWWQFLAVFVTNISLSISVGHQQPIDITNIVILSLTSTCH